MLTQQIDKVKTELNDSRDEGILPLWRVQRWLKYGHWKEVKLLLESVVCFFKGHCQIIKAHISQFIKLIYSVTSCKTNNIKAVGYH